MTIPIIPYLAGGRELCVTGACVLTASRDLIGKAIRFFEGKGAWCSHAAAVVRLPESLVSRERVTLIESLEHGPTPTYLSHYFEGFDGRLFLFVPAGITPEIQTRFAAWCLDKVLKQVKYDYAGIVQQIRGHVASDDGRLFCSELVGSGWEASGLPRKPDFAGSLDPQPPDLAAWWPGELFELLGPFSREAA